MHTYISLLRGINVSGQKKIKMVDLRALYESLGLANVQSYVQGGNVIFESLETDRAQLAERIETKISEVYGFSVPVFILDPVDVQRVIAANPFAAQDPTKLVVTFLKHPPSETAFQGIKVPPSGRDEYAFGEQEIFIFCPDGFGRSKLNNNLWEQRLKIPATTRNWKTVRTLYQMAVNQK
jgi:uncharacterized protein (DUF1697 family)